MAKNFVQPGNVIPFTAGADTVSGQVVVIGALLGVSLTDVASGAEGEAQITGVFRVPKVSAAVIAAGETLTFDISAADGVGEFDDNAAVAAAGDITGAAAVAFEAAGAGVTSLLVRFTGVPGTVETGA